jgi:hypothetical protein
MKYRKNYIKLPLIVFLIMLFIKTLQLVSTWIRLSEMDRKYVEKYPTPWSLIFTVQTKVVLVCTFIAMCTLVIYFLLRRRYINVLYCQIHIWLSFISLIAIPLLSRVYKMRTPNGTVSDAVRIGNVIVYPFSSLLSLFVFIIAFTFFILTVVKSTTSPKDSRQTVQSTGFLDDFAGQ